MITGVDKKMSTRLSLKDTMIEACMKMSDGNPGALRVCSDLINYGGLIDTDSAFGGFSNVMDLDSLGVYGGRIWMLYKDVCGESLWKMIAVLRANQLGIIDENGICHAIDNRGDGIDIEKCINEVTNRLTGFVIPLEE